MNSLSVQTVACSLLNGGQTTGVDNAQSANKARGKVKKHRNQCQYTGRPSLWQVVNGLFFVFHIFGEYLVRVGPCLARRTRVRPPGHPCEHFLWNFKPFDKSSCQSFTSCHRRLSCGKSEDLMLIIKERPFSVAVDIVWLFAWSTIFQTVTLKLYFKFHIIPLQLLVLLNFKLRQFHFIPSNVHCTATQHVCNIKGKAEFILEETYHFVAWPSLHWISFKVYFPVLCHRAPPHPRGWFKKL